MIATPFEVVIVDDHEDSCVMLTELLVHRGFAVRWFTDGRILLRNGAARSADVVMADLQMPGISGVELARALRADRETVAALVAISGIFGPYDEVAKEFDAYLLKPLDLSLLPDRIHPLAQSARARRAQLAPASWQ